MIKQRTLKNIIKTNGIGLHTGKKITLILKPALENTGIIYRRIDLNPYVDFKVNANLVKNTFFCTCLINNYDVRISTVEHLHAALSGLGIDNIIIEVNGPEIPIMDGSSIPFIYLLLKSGIKELKTDKKFIKIKKTIIINDKDKWVKLSPFNGFTFNFTIDFNHPAIDINVQNYFFNFSSNNFIKKISPARTFGFVKNIKNLRSKGLILGGNLNSAIILDDYKVINKNGLRFKNELVRHKILDAIGDLYMCGYNIIGSFSAFKSGHKMNNKLLRTILKSKKSWKFIKLDNLNNPFSIF
ncbi:UDP-3-O-acyl-N-acetylglucosamine deacetylase [Sodalis-like secondary symbiont of Drepanosiphum platanoidis]|uniref:UDP-3-O-acyl-N-acetylglucosamine deacetylase n=1 Tax=Sodalis-like secondary symbiont of Drepanosiphum platanoidis TaxID=2994493 RepID=UPI0034640343